MFKITLYVWIFEGLNCSEKRIFLILPTSSFSMFNCFYFQISQIPWFFSSSIFLQAPKIFKRTTSLGVVKCAYRYLSKIFVTLNTAHKRRILEEMELFCSKVFCVGNKVNFLGGQISSLFT